ncbi:unnamed protein product [Protopolystoma xenopodis]|uniref:Uncharacterized protein n=1 Tax=Protopolystoma xenopodis TaxID=117903 RepID=A0A3S5FDJ6_9PLAT|nr:unnamed protein product [Protopolystoma xenopodis]
MACRNACRVPPSKVAPSGFDSCLSNEHKNLAKSGFPDEFDFTIMQALLRLHTEVVSAGFLVSVLDFEESVYNDKLFLASPRVMQSRSSLFTPNIILPQDSRPRTKREVSSHDEFSTSSSSLAYTLGLPCLRTLASGLDLLFSSWPQPSNTHMLWKPYRLLVGFQLHSTVSLSPT